MKEKEIYMNNMVTLDKVSPSKAILVFESGGEIVGIVYKYKAYRKWDGVFKIQFIKGVQSEENGLPQLVETWQKEGYTFKTQFSPGGPLREIVTDDSWIHVNNITNSNLVLVKKGEDFIGMVQFDAGEYFIATSINDIEEDLRFTTSLRVLVEEGQKQGYSFFLQVKDTQ